MRRSVNWLVVLLSALFLLAGTLLPAGCGSSAGGDPEELVGPPAAAGMLRPVRDAAELEDALKSALTNVVTAGAPPNAVLVSGGMTPSSFSGTYTVEAGVDELDFVRYDGTHLFVAPPQSGSSPADSVIRILRTDPASATATQVGTIPIDSSQIVTGMYVANGRLFLVTSEVFAGPNDGIWPALFVWAPTRFRVQVHDVSNPAHPRRLLSATIDGGVVASRRIGDRVVLVSRHTPRAVLDSTQRARISRLQLAELLPAMTIDERQGSLVDPRRCYVTNDGRRSGNTVLTYITTFSLANPRDINAICYDEAANGVYASRDSLYVSEPRLTTNYDESTRIHKFSLNGARAEYAGSVEVPGSVWSGGQFDFRMNESEGLLRVMTTRQTIDAADFTDHQLFVLRQKPDQPELEIIGRLPNDARPEEIGKPNESLYAVRFDGDRAYAVTFRRVDPLYVIDLSSPADPRIAGQLLLPGVSEFLHPISDDLLLGLGSEGNHFKIELFDTSVLEHPQSRGAITLGGIHSDSPARYDRHAFTYLAGENSDRLAVPGIIYTGQPGVGFGYETSLRQFEILGKQSASSASLQEAGAVSIPAEPAFGNYRAFIHGDTVYYVRDGNVWATFWSTPSQVNGPF
ncbi:MAG TPA: beta-propeller domain-containing protein [Vicinamibacterales bacterium]|nr:beta-propeller domain-containing protein [Vicinamibacterales bacterium]